MLVSTHKIYEANIEIVEVLEVNVAVNVSWQTMQTGELGDWATRWRGAWETGRRACEQTSILADWETGGGTSRGKMGDSFTFREKNHC